MGVILPKHNDSYEDWQRSCAGGECYFCAKPVLDSEPLVNWRGYNSLRGDAGGIVTAVMHVRCAEELGRNLIKDAHDIQLGGPGAWRKRLLDQEFGVG